MKEKFYITTAIAYASQKPHIGNVYEIVLTDFIARYKRMQGFDVHFLTGTDEHGQKIQEKAKAAGISPQEYVDKITGEIKEIWKKFEISNDDFIRTTDERHRKTVQKIFKKLYEKGDIYKSTYEGLYCTPCESFWTSTQASDGCCPDCGGKVSPAKEEAYFLKLSKYQDALLKYFEEHDEFITPSSRKNEMINNFLKPGLQDLCVSRTSFDWGIPVEFDPRHVTYVWVDALSNYITAIGYDPDGSSEQFEKLWPADLHVIGKDIVRFHTIYWPIILMGLGVELPKKVLGHPWLLIGEDKMSKSKGNALYGDDLIDLFGLDAIRYYLLSEMPFANDGSITYENIIARTNTDLANILGNLVSRTAAMIEKYFDGVIPSPETETEFDAGLKAAGAEAFKVYTSKLEEYKVSEALAAPLAFLKSCNKYIDETAPWVLAKDEANTGKLKSVLANLVEGIRMAATMLKPAIPGSVEKIAAVYGFGEEALDIEKAGSFEYLASGNKVSKGEPLFARIDEKEFFKKMDSRKSEKEAQKTAKKEEKAAEKSAKKELPEGKISIDDFAKVSLVACKVLECEAVPKSDKLLKLIVDIGTEKRQVVSGIAKFYSPEQLVGKTVVLVENLAPVKLRGVESCGMILASGEEDVKVIELDPSVPAGTKIR
ncbi:MAG: methionine--tRNA ligase [Clostridia bacterium]|nr:methionine--tRNA ligase [Clostridia bacterium]